MHKLVLLVVILTVGIALAGCQQSGLTEEEVRSIVREEVTNQLATEQLKGIIGQEISRQISSIEKLTVSELNIINEDGKDAINLYTSRGAGYIQLSNSDGELTTWIFSDEDGDPHFVLVNRYGDTIIMIGASNGDGQIGVQNKYGDLIFTAP